MGTSLTTYAKSLFIQYTRLGHVEGLRVFVDQHTGLSAALAEIRGDLAAIEKEGGIEHAAWKEGTTTQERYVVLQGYVSDMIEWAGRRKLKNAGKSGVLLFQQS